jgi:inner membrane protein
VDTLTHALFGLGVGALRRPDGAPATDRAVLLGCAIAAELPDLDYLWPAGDAVLRALQAHRGPSHALVAAPLVAAAATGIARLVFRRARVAPVYAMALCAVVLAHLLPDLWTGWGTRLAIPFSEARLALDWTMVVDPLVTLPLLAGAVWAWRRRGRWRRAILVGLAVALGYVGARIALREALAARVAAAYPAAERVAVFPALLRVATWRYVVLDGGVWVAGSVAVGDGVIEEARHPPGEPLAAAERAAPPVREALAWARFPVVRVTRDGGGVSTVRVADLRYHLRGAPTLEIVVELRGGEVLRSSFERGGSAKELIERWRGR